MFEQPQSLIALLLYFVLFGWIGVRRGWKRELMVFVFALGGYVVLLEFQGLLAFFANTGINYARAGFPSDRDGLLAVFEAEQLISEGNRNTFAFLLWAAYLFGVYYISDRLFTKDPGRARSAGFLAGVANSLLYLSLVASRLVPVIESEAELTPAAPRGQVSQVFRGVGDLLERQVTDLWNGISRDGQRALVLWTILIILGIAAFSLYNNSRRSQAQK